MTDWKKVISSQPDQPSEVERTSSPTTVYFRRNIEQIERKVSEDTDEMVIEWQYEEMEMSVEEYNNMILMQQVVTENTQGIVESVTEFQREAVIDEYTQKLIEEGVI